MAKKYDGWDYASHPIEGKSYDELKADNARLRSVVTDLLESYLATFHGNKDELARRAEALLADQQTANELRSRD